MGEYLASNEGVGGYADGVLAIIATLPLIGVAEVDEKLLATPFGELLQAKMEAFATCLGAFYVVVYLRATQARVLQLIPMVRKAVALPWPQAVCYPTHPFCLCCNVRRSTPRWRAWYSRSCWRRQCYPCFLSACETYTVAGAALPCASASRWQ